MEQGSNQEIQGFRPPAFIEETMSRISSEQNNIKKIQYNERRSKPTTTRTTAEETILECAEEKGGGEKVGS